MQVVVVEVEHFKVLLVELEVMAEVVQVAAEMVMEHLAQLTQAAVAEVVVIHLEILEEQVVQA
jgi:hypothetical protein